MTSTSHAPYPFNIEIQLEIKPQPSKLSIVPIELNNFKLPNVNNSEPSYSQLWIVKHDGNNNHIVFDHDAIGDNKYKVPYRYEPAYDGLALPIEADNGKLIFLASNQPCLQYYSIYFDSKKIDSIINEYGGLIGDGDTFMQKTGRLAVAGSSKPIWYGNDLFATRGLLVASSYNTGLSFFQEIQSKDKSKPDYINKGRLRDCEGNLIAGIPTVFDYNKNGKLDLVIGKLDGTICWHENKGSNEKPIYAPLQPLKTESGEPLQIRKYLEGKYREVRKSDGSINSRYPKMRIIMHHGHAIDLTCTPIFADWNNNGNHDLIVGTPGDFLLYFRQTTNGFAEGIFIKDTEGQAIRCGAFPTVTDWNNDGKPDILCGNYHGYVNYLENTGNKNGIPIFKNHGHLNIKRDIEYSFPFVCDYHGNKTLMVGNFYGEIKYYKLTDASNKQTPEIGNCQYLEMSNAPITRQMPLAQYVDLNNNGKLDIVSGDIKGGLFFYKNIGTNRNPLFQKAQQLCDTNGPIMLLDGPDPMTPEDGYSKVFAFDITGNGYKDLIIGTGLGQILVCQSEGMNSSGNPILQAPEVLRDTKGNEIRCHHMSAPLITDWNGDGTPDLIVTGQKNVHYYPDPDPDPSQLRWYKGRLKKSKLEFEPYVPLIAQGDMEITYRPIPSAITEENGQKILHIGQKLFLQPNPSDPCQLEFLAHEPWRIAFATEPIICAYHSIGELAKNDSAIIQGSCVGWIYAFREAFLNNGYPSIAGKIISVKSLGDDKKATEKLIKDFSFTENNFPDYKPPNVNNEYKLEKLPQTYDPEHIESSAWESIPKICTFMNSASLPLPENLKCTFQAATTPDGLCIKINCREPEMNRLICAVDHDNGPMVDYNEDRIEICIDTNLQNQYYYCWIFNAKGYCKEINILRKTGMPHGRWQISNTKRIKSKTSRDTNSWTLQCTIPFSKLCLDTCNNNSILFQIKRVRNLYATEKIPALECKTSDTFSFPNKTQNWCRLIK